MSSGKILNEENFKQALEDIKKERAPLGFVPTHYVVNSTERPKPTMLERVFLAVLSWLIGAAYRVAWKLEDWKTNK